MKTGEYPSRVQHLLDNFGVHSPHEVSWAHKTNSQKDLNKATRNPSIMMVEGDISYLPDTAELIMAHYNWGHPEMSYNSWLTLQSRLPKREKLYFNEWLKTIINAHTGAKLDFKDPQAVVPCLELLREVNEHHTTPIILSADIFPGPGGRPPLFEGREFISLCNELYPDAILSLGWVTEYIEGGKYNKELLEEILNIGTLYKGAVTFTIRACFARASHRELQWFFKNTDHTITIWNNEVIPNELMEWLQREMHSHRVFYDIDTGSYLPVR